ncbi:bifunctional riboflavin kinase/FAD synthetase [Pseudobacter ginsenosidimutans]|uniref:Riboflavin biosynthesis protein n=1 Tax=Pseudobacter ginsenosidimutans TaxID=661488 RepID=A0A4Q7N0N7_9BACT|nr:bifunctional riboflavin kinase/FAD synthetase [Pseudobacter ginsenosidimutans]QEC43735.1 bifunctional riboflavin kinase/FAD synthetase [Pseudobacter ginsenosidimutans]RZS75147.1 riboflavin kinase/FMN adenylyltransferase [Pseudobacter ginsenosidimutans]
MKVYHSTEQMPVFRNAVVTIGTFDGVHIGHQQILTQLKQEAERIQGETVIITFHPHPRKVVAAGQAPVYLINTIEEKIELLERNGIDNLVIVPFTESFSQQTPEEYCEHFLIEKFHPHTVIIGYDHRFGKGRKGDYKLLEDYSARLGFELKEIPAHVINESTVSSTRIREAVLGGDIGLARSLLGYDFFFEGKVVEGNKLGRTLGYPTANLQLTTEEKLVPGNGVYAVTVVLPSGETKQGMMNIGVRPTVDGTKRMIEVNIFDFNQDIYGSVLRVYVQKYLRGEQKFNGLDALKQQLAIDKENVLRFFTPSS